MAQRSNIDFLLVVELKGVVLALNARVLAKDPKPFDSILKDIPQLQLLVWTGTGEPPISERKIDGIKDHFGKIGLLDQVGFDCQVRRVLYTFNNALYCFTCFYPFFRLFYQDCIFLRCWGILRQSCPSSWNFLECTEVILSNLN